MLINIIVILFTEDKLWRTDETAPSHIKPMYGHSSVLHQDTGRIYIHGGYRMLNSTCFKTSDETFYYQRDRKDWYHSSLHSSGVPRYLHSAVLVGGTMIVLGGRGDSALVPSQMMVFDIGKCVTDCNLDNSRIDLFRLGGLLPHFRPCDDSLENSSFQIFK